MNEMEDELLAEQFEKHRQHLLWVAYRMLGSLGDAEDVVQETWLRLRRASSDDVYNLGGWLTTVTSRICLDVLRARKSRREDSLESILSEKPATIPNHPRVNAADEAEMADSVGLAMLVVLERLTPCERVALVLHDMFDYSYEEVAAVIGKSPVATRQLASRARRRVSGSTDVTDADRQRKREVIDAYLAAARRGDFEALMAILDPAIEFEADAAAVLAGASIGDGTVEDAARRAIKFRAVSARTIYIDDDAGIVVAPRGHLKLIIKATVTDGRITKFHAIADPKTLEALNLGIAEG